MMKKMKTAAFMSAILLFVLSISTGCSDIVPETSAVSKETEISIETLTESLETNSENTTETTEAVNIDSAAEWESKAKSLYDDACNMYFGIIFNGSYFETNYNTTDELGANFYEISDSRVSTIADVKAEMRKVFSESYASQFDNNLSDVYKELDGKLYQGERGKGGNVALEDVDIEFISADDSKASFNAIAHYVNESDKIEPFTLVYENGDWKVSEFSDPNLFMKDYETGSSSTEKEQWESKARALYDDACNMYFGIIFNGSYFETNYNTTDELGANFYEISDSRVSTVADVKAEMRKVFSESYVSQYDNKINDKYKEYDGKLYQVFSGKGGNVALEDVDIEFISADDSKASFNAVAHYINEPDITEPFTLVYENDDWKVSEFSDPNLFMRYETGSITDVTISTDNIEKEQWESKAQQLYSDANDVFFGIIINGTYFNTSDTIYYEQGIPLNKVSDSRVSTVADVKAEIRKIFSESYASQYDNKISNKYKEIDGVLYQIMQNKGGVFSMEDIDIEFISADDKKAKFNAIVHEPGGTDVYGVDPFTLVYESGSWKVSEYTYY